MGKEEQLEEREVLDSIFPDEITDLSENSFRVAVALEVPGSNGDEEEDEPPVLWLTVTYPENYPDEAPRLDLSAPPNATKHPDLDIQDDKTQLMDALEPTIEENMGMAMVFTLVSTLKDSAELLISERQNAAKALEEVAAQEQEAKENEKFQGTQVTPQSFQEWRTRFVAEMQAEKEKAKEEKEAEDKKKRVNVSEKKMTGRMLWEKGLVGKIEEEEDDDDGEDALKGVEKMAIKT